MISHFQAGVLTTLLMCFICGCSALRPALAPAQTTQPPGPAQPADKADNSEATSEVAYLALAVPSQQHDQITHLNALHPGIVPQLQAVAIGKNGLTLGEATERLNTHYEAVRLLDYRRRSVAAQAAYKKEAATSVLKFVVIRRTNGARVDDYLIPFQMVTNGIARLVQIQPSDIVRIEFIDVRPAAGTVPIGSPAGTPPTISVTLEGRVTRAGTTRVPPTASLSTALNGQLPNTPTLPDIAVLHRTDKSTGVSQHFLIDFNGPFRDRQNLDLAARALILQEFDRIGLLYSEEIPLLQSAAVASQAMFATE